MTIVELYLDDQAFERIKHIAARHHGTVETLIQDLVQRLVAIETTADPLLRMFAQEPDLMDAVSAAVMSARETDPLSLTSGRQTKSMHS
jgi:hypothetical protein